MVHVSVDALSRSRPLLSAVLCQENVLLGLLKGTDVGDKYW
jgi:hypothetical protein